ncbi:hypothetical protein GX51_08008 [Blastomyces parvus]|uniref:Phosphoribosyltransferase domain-containing protein n=1 Tax=Blastomyces parvus TaxID=2060905 RepID=A0A2B7WHP7_9EURO|nr:hypothetical protein GX51_08008 [Blastomyces parvus]
MRSACEAPLRFWYGRLRFPPQSTPSWYRDRLREELQERRLAKTPWQKLSERSDVFFAITRARYDGILTTAPKLPSPFAPRYMLVYTYMLAKYTSRWMFYRTAAIFCSAPCWDLVCEVVNPNKDHKLEEVASRHQMDPARFRRDDGFLFYDGSQVIEDLVPGGLPAFHDMSEAEKSHWRDRAIRKIQLDCVNNDRAAVVAGHYMFWDESEEVSKTICTAGDLDVYTHILFLNVPAEVIASRRQNDKDRSRPIISVSHLRRWQYAEMSELCSLCPTHGIWFTPVHTALISNAKSLVEKAAALLRDFRSHTKDYNLLLASRKLDETIAAIPGQLDTMLVMDGDKTLAEEDAGVLFWQKALTRIHLGDPLKALFGSPLGYSYPAFRQAILLYEEECDDDKDFDDRCETVASEINIYPEIRALLQHLSTHTHVGVVVVTSGLHRVWEKVLKRACLADRVKVISGSRLTDSFVVTPEAKGALVARLRDVHKMYVWAFGDSPVDMEMLKGADQAIVVVGHEHTRSKSMDVSLRNAIDAGHLQARQALLPPNVSPRLDTAALPLVQLTDEKLIASILSNPQQRVFHASDRAAAKLLMTPMRHADNAGPSLREAHRRTGSYLATEFLATHVGLEGYPIRHVQGTTVTGYQLLHEEKTLIVALMRGGEPMAFGVNEVFPRAMFLHARNPDEIREHHLEGIRNIFLVDSVVNTGRSILEFVEYIRELNTTTRIVVVSGAVQAEAVSVTGPLRRLLANDVNISIVTLRLSDNKFTSRGTTDTGHRLFNTTHLD